MADGARGEARRPLHVLERLSPWLVLLLGMAGIGAVGLLDYLTDDYSVLVAYVPPVAFTAWFAGRWRGVAVCLAAGGIRYLADLAWAGSTFVHLWNASEDTLFLLLISFLISWLRKALD